MKKIAGIVLVVVVLVVVVVIVKYRQEGVMQPDHIIPLSVSGTGADCRVDRLPARAVVRRRQPVIWRITNNCAVDATVEMFDFRKDSKTGTPSDPLEDTDETQDPGRRRTISPGNTGTIPTRVRNNADYGVYSYRIRVNGTDFDPEVEVSGQD